VKTIRFDRVGTFQFSFETGTTSEPLGDPIPPEVKQERYNRLMELQHGISLEINQTFVGKTLPVLIEGAEGARRTPTERCSVPPLTVLSLAPTERILIGRSYRDAPEIDGVVVVEGAPAGIPIGDIVPVRITGAMAYDLNGILAESPLKATVKAGEDRPITGGVPADAHRKGGPETRP